MTMTILKSSISSNGIDASKNQFHNGIGFTQWIDSVESMPGILKSLKIQVLEPDLAPDPDPSTNKQKSSAVFLC
jgi:hypothetical protein